VSAIAPGVEATPTMTKRRTHRTMRPSGARELGDIPTHWDLKRLRFIGRMNPSKSDVSSLPVDTTVSFLPMERIGEDYSLSLEDTRMLGAVDQGYTYFRDDDVIVAKITPCFENGKGSLCRGLVNGIGFGTTELHVIRAGSDVTPSFLAYVTMSHGFRLLGTASMKGAAGQQRVPDDFIKNYLVPLPPLEEQQAITAFLDHETAKIDALIAKKERMIEVLNEHRLALIQRAVTKGIDRIDQWKPSGIGWIGDIPMDWEVWKVSHAFGFIASGTTPSTTVYDYYDGDVPWVNTAELRDGLVTGTAKKVTQKALADHSSLRIYQPGTLLIALYGATIGRLGILDIAATTNQACCALSEPIHLSISFVFYWLLAHRNQLILLASGGGQPNISQDIIRSLQIPAPSVSKQSEIAHYLDKKVARIDPLISKIGSHITALHEHRSALISAAVTGKIDIREDVSRW